MFSISRFVFVLMLPLVLASFLMAEPWVVLGPDGGDARSLAYDPQDPNHVLLGTGTGEIFSSSDGGRSWSRLAQLGPTDDYVLDHIIIDPKESSIIYISAWSLLDLGAGDIFRSNDAGKTWKELPAMHGKSIRAMAMSGSDSKILVAGALDGVFRTTDSGDTWTRMSPEHHAEIKNIESVAIDPKDPNVVYAGTWHLPWRTTDGGATWTHMNKGIIDDSDVFSIIVDRTNPAVVFASACSGIYKSVTAGELFQKIQGIPFSARRTRVLKQDPILATTIYAGTTEGLWKTVDGGKLWKRVTGPEVVVNDVLIDPRDSNRVLLATDRAGVYASEDGAATFTVSNHGYTHRFVNAILADRNDPVGLYVGIVNDRELGGVFYTRDNGEHWQQKSNGLGGRDVFTLKQAPNGTLIAGSNRGMFALDANATTWRPISASPTDQTVTTHKKGSKKPIVTHKTVKAEIESRVNDVEVDSTPWVAATASGLYSSTDQGKTWKGGPVLGHSDFISVRNQGQTMVAATRSTVLVSDDGGLNWKQTAFPAAVNRIHGLALTPSGKILVAAREGGWRSSDRGITWEQIFGGLPYSDLTSISGDEDGKRVLATSQSTGIIYESMDEGNTWQKGPDTGYPLRRVERIRGRYYAATPFDGVIAQPQTEVAPAAPSGNTK